MPGLQVTPPDVSTAPSPIRCDHAQLECELGGTGERVAALVHRRRTRVRCLAAPGDPVALDPERAQDGAEWQVQGLEHRALLDVQLEVGGGVPQLGARLERRVELDPVLPQGVGQCDPVPIGQLAQFVLVRHRARRRGGAEERAPEPRALLVGPVDEPHRHRRRPFLGDPPQHLDAGDDVEAAVEPAAVRHRVDVPADQHGAGGAAAERPPLVSGRIDLVLER